MQLLFSNPLPSPEFVSLSLVLQPDTDNPNGCGMGEPLLLASPLSTISYTDATDALKELHKYLSSLSALLAPAKKEMSIHDQIVAELMREDEKLLDKMQVFRPMKAHGIGLHYRLLREERIKNDFSSLVLASSRAATGTTVAETDHRNIEKTLLGVLMCVGISGLPYAHCSSSLQYGLSQRMKDCVGLLSNRMSNNLDVSAAKTILSTLLATEDEVRKTNEVADCSHSTAIPESGEDTLGFSQKKGSSLKSAKRLSVVSSKLSNIATLGLLSRATGETNMHVGLDPTSNDLARELMERLNVLSVAEHDSLLRLYETSGQQRKANLDLTGNKSRFRKRKTDSTTNADLDNFDYKGPVRDRRPTRLRQGAFQQNSSSASLQSNNNNTVSAQPLSSSRGPPLSSKAHIRQHRADGQGSRRSRAVPTLSAPRGDVSSSRRSSIAALRSEEHSQEDDARSRRSGKSHGSRRATADIVSSNWTGTDGTNSTEDLSETSPSVSSSGQHRIQVTIALNEDLTCSYKFSKMTACSVEGVIQVQVKTNSRTVVPFQLLIRDPSQHIQTLQENKKFAEDTSGSLAPDQADRSFTVAVPKGDNYFPLIRYKCSNELRPVPIRVQTRVKVDSGFCRVALQISSNPHNEGSLTDLTIIMGVANDIKGETLVTQPAGGVWNASKRSVIWCVSELGDGEKFQLQARFEIDSESAGEEVPKFPVLVRCQCMGSQLSDVSVAARDQADVYPAEVASKVARRYRLSHQERS